MLGLGQEGDRPVDVDAGLTSKVLTAVGTGGEPDTEADDRGDPGGRTGETPSQPVNGHPNQLPAESRR